MIEIVISIIKIGISLIKIYISEIEVASLRTLNLEFLE